METNLLRNIPKVDQVFKLAQWKDLLTRYPEAVARESLRECLDELRTLIREGAVSTVPDPGEIIARTEKRIITSLAPGLKTVINGTGIIIHTNLGRSILARSAIDAINSIASRYSNLEYDLGEGRRGDRYTHCTSILKKLTGAEAALVVNNNAAAVLLVLNTLAEGKEVIISRGELVEIGGSFRIPDVMKKSGAILREVGTTNRTYISDFETAISQATGLLMRAHKSNFRIKGFVHEATTEEMVSLGRRQDLPIYYDAGSGLLYSPEGIGLHDEPVIPDELRKGIDVISFSGDKILGGPQAGIIIGKKALVDAMKENPITRAFRPDKFTLAGLEATLILYLDIDLAIRHIPTLRMIHEKGETLKKRAHSMETRLKRLFPDLGATVIETISEVGGGSFPDFTLPSFAVALKPSHMDARELEALLRDSDPPVIGRMEKERLLLDMRTIPDEDEGLLIQGISSAFHNER